MLIGNNYGSFRLRTDEGGPKFLTGGWTKAGGVQFGGGFGHLFDEEKRLLSSYYSGGPRERQFGIGYAKWTARSAGLSATHTVAVPVGSDPVVLVQVDIERSPGQVSSDSHGTFRWCEVFGSLMMHLDPAWSHTANRSTFTATHYKSSWLRAPEGGAALHRRKWLGLTQAEARHLAAGCKSSAAAPFASSGLSKLLHTDDNPTPRGGGMWDEAPPSPFLAEVPCGANATTAISNNAASYFGVGTAAEPDAPPRLGKLPFV